MNDIDQMLNKYILQNSDFVDNAIKKIPTAAIPAVIEMLQKELEFRKLKEKL